VKPKTKKVLINLSAIAGSILLLIGVFFATYTYYTSLSVDSYTKMVKQYAFKINTINENTGSYIKNETIDNKKTKVEIEGMINNLLKIKNSVDSLNPSEKYKESKNNLSSGLNSNIYIYKQIQQIVNNPQAKDGDAALVDLKRYKDECVKYYSLINLKGVTISLSNKAIIFIDNTNYYLEEAIKIRKKNEIAQGLSLDFLNAIDEIVSSLLPIKIDYEPYAVMARDGKLNEALAKIDGNKTIFDGIKSKLTKITVPSSGIPLFKSLNKTLNTEGSYIQGFRYALDIEGRQAISAPLKSEEIQALYSDTTILLKNLNSNYDGFLKLYTEFKNNFLWEQ